MNKRSVRKSHATDPLRQFSILQIQRYSLVHFVLMAYSRKYQFWESILNTDISLKNPKKSKRTSQIGVGPGGADL